ncbi:MAG TPA: ectonucleotide pyrophosphatase/phosphodiesterase, partial [Acidobacteriaceae bacterium]|nr:ectonucleotide pyrophosphatase/phosphodiesterase [Acidobacteriaceae bacterium]
MISIDGMRPDYVTHADEHGLKIPTLRRFMAEGSYADGVRGVFPTVTYPSHTTLVTGVWPATHGILNNQVFDPEQHFAGAWYWYADSMKVQTLWQAAHAAGIRTASVSWPVTVDADAIDDNLPEYWRSDVTGAHADPRERFLMNAVSRPSGSLKAMQARLGPYMPGNDTTIEGDRIRTRFAVDILRRNHPGFMTVHLSSLDEEEHIHAPFSPEANADLEALDGLVHDLTVAERDANPAATVVVVSDHGFAPIHDAVNLYIPFLHAGLITAGKPAPGSFSPAITAWKAEPWLASGMAAIVLHDPADVATRTEVKQLLESLQADPANGIARILTAEEARHRGAFPDAAFLVLLKPGFYTGAAVTGPLLTPTPGRGTHGYAADDPQMYASFFAIGPDIAQHQDLGLIDMRQIAPTVAGLLGVELPEAEGKPLSLHSKADR